MRGNDPVDRWRDLPYIGHLQFTLRTGEKAERQGANAARLGDVMVRG